jgi:hypothetical protein
MWHKKIKMAIVCALFAAAVPLCGVYAQGTSTGGRTPIEVITEIYRTYDSLSHITFDVKFTYNTDTLQGDFTYDVLEGNYTMAGKKARYNLGDIEFMQNDSFFISVYKKDNFMIVADPQAAQAGGILPMRQLIDSLLRVYAPHYTISVVETTEEGSISFEARDSLAQFRKFLISYDMENKVLKEVRYLFEEPTLPDPLSTVPSAPAQLRQRNLRIEFSNYRFDNFSADLYDENNYVFVEDGVWKPASRFADFRVFYSRTGVIGGAQGGSSTQ